MPRLTIEHLTRIAERAIVIRSGYTGLRRGELFLDAILNGLLDGRFGAVHRQDRLQLRKGQRRQQRIDFRIGGNSPVVIEIACRSFGGELAPSQNRSELQKLTRHRMVATRYLLLLDPTKHSPLKKAVLQQLYRDWNPGPGRFDRLPVRVIYARSPQQSFNFLWRGRR